jgi:hypothetical protein
LPALPAEFGDQARHVGLGQAERTGPFLPIGESALPPTLLQPILHEVAQQLSGRPVFFFGRRFHLG